MFLCTDLCSIFCFPPFLFVVLFCHLVVLFFLVLLVLVARVVWYGSQEGRRKLNAQTKKMSTLSGDLARAVESRIDMELGLKSVRSKLDRAEETMKKMKQEKSNHEAMSEQKFQEAKEETGKLQLALSTSRRKQETLIESHRTISSKFEQMKTMLQHLADANGQVARVYGALGSRLTEVRAEQAAARGSLEATREGLLFLRSRIEDGSTEQKMNRSIVSEKDALLEERQRRLTGIMEEMQRMTSERDELRYARERDQARMRESDIQKSADDKVRIIMIVVVS